MSPLSVILPTAPGTPLSHPETPSSSRIQRSSTQSLSRSFNFQSRSRLPFPLFVPQVPESFKQKSSDSETKEAELLEEKRAERSAKKLKMVTQLKDIGLCFSCFVLVAVDVHDETSLGYGEKRELREGKRRRQKRAERK